MRLPIDPRLAEILAAERVRLGDVIPLPERPMVIGVRGRPYIKNGFRALFFRLRRRLETAGTVGPDLTFHGLRSTAAVRLIDAGGSLNMVQALLGHRTVAMAAHYARRFNRDKLGIEAVRLIGEASIHAFPAPAAQRRRA